MTSPTPSMTPRQRKLEAKGPTRAADTMHRVSKDEKRLTVRIDAELKRQVHTWAIRNDTSINQIIIDCLEKFIIEKEETDHTDKRHL